MLLLALTALLVFLAASRWRASGFEWAVFTSGFRHMDWRWISLALVLILLTYFGRALRWEVMLRPICPQPSMRNLMSATVIGFTAVVLFGRAGELVRPYLIAVKEGVTFSSQMAAWLLERIFDILIILILLGFSMTGLDEQGLSPRLEWVIQVGGYFIAIVGSLCLIVLVAVGQFPQTVQARMLDALAFLPKRYHSKAGELISTFLSGMQSVGRFRFVILMSVYSLIEWLLIAVGYLCAFRAFPGTAGLDLGDVLVFMGFVSFGSLVQIPGVGGGMQVVSIVVLTEMFGVGLEAATGVALLLWGFTLVIIPFGLLQGVHEGIKWKNLRDLEVKASA